jgi:small redox-active disulfide protein 2
VLSEKCWVLSEKKKTVVILKGGKKMKKIQILGTGCPKCMKLTANAEEAAKQAGIEFEIEKVTDIKQIMNYGVMMTPALAIDGQVKSVGKILSPEEIKKLL